MRPTSTPVSWITNRNRCCSAPWRVPASGGIGGRTARSLHRIARYLEDLATAYHKFYDSCRVPPRGDEEVEPITIARLWLCSATRQVLANGLDLLGVSARTVCNLTMPAHPAGPRHGDVIEVHGAPPRPADPDALASLDPAIWPTSADRGTDGPMRIGESL